MPWALRATKPIPGVSTETRDFEFNDYSKGINNYVANDVEKPEYLRYAQDARMPTLGEYETRKGCDYLSDAVGETQDQAVTSTTGAGNQSFSTTVRLAQVFTTASAGRLSKVEVNLKNDDGATGTVIVEIYSDSSGEPGTLLARSSVSNGSITSSYAYHTARFVTAPVITTATDYWIVCYVQTVGSDSYKWSSTTSATTALSSDDSGDTWEATDFALNFKQHYATNAGTKGLHIAYKSDGTKNDLFASGTALYSVNLGNGAVSSVKTGLNASASKYRFVTINDIVYYVNGFDGLRKWNFTTESQVSSDNGTILAQHRGLLFIVDKDDPNKIRFSNFADYETFTSTDFIYVPSPKTGDPITGMESLNGTLVIFTRFNKYVLYGADNATFQLEQAPGRKGTFSQETLCSDKNFIYFLSDDGVYKFNGTQDTLISQNIYQTILEMGNKDQTCMVFNRGRIRLYYPSSGSSFNDRCIVFNVNFDSIESFDTDTYVRFAVTAFNDSDKLVVASSVVGQIFYQENEDNDYTNAGGDINFYIQTHSLPFGSPARFKEIRYWKPRFAAQSGNYTIACEYSPDLRDSPTTEDNQNTQGSGYIWGDSDTVWGSFTWGTTSELQSDLSVPGEYRRVQFRYKHYATRQPHKFLGHTFVVELRRLR